MASERWVPIYSRLFDPDHELAGDDPVCQRWAWADICFMAQYKDGTRIFSGKVVTLRRGEFLASLRFLEKRWRWSKNRVARFLKALEKVDKIQPVETHRSGTVFAVVRYDDYCPSRDSDEPTYEPGRGPAREPRDGDASGTDVGQITEGPERATSTTGVDWPAVPAATPFSAAVGEFVTRTRTKWRLKDKGIQRWCLEIEKEPEYAGVNFAFETRAAADWHVSEGKSPSQPDRALRNWFKIAAKSANKPSPQSDFLAHMEKAIAARGGLT